MLGLSLKDFNKHYRNDLAHLFSTITQQKDTLKIPDEYKGDKFDKFVAQFLNYTLSGNYELDKPIPKGDITIPHGFVENFFRQNPQLMLSFLCVLVYKDKRLRKLLKGRYIGTKEQEAVDNTLLVISYIWFDSGQSIKDKNNSMQGKGIYEILTKRNSQ
jgi:hypothetical protein